MSRLRSRRPNNRRWRWFPACSSRCSRSTSTRLSHDFELYGEPRGSGWVLGLKPRAEALGSVFRQAVVSGGATVERVVLEDGNGDRSEIVLQGVQYDAAGLTADERRRF